MNWAWLRRVPWIDTRAAFVARAPKGSALLDLGSSDGETLRHFAELRPDLRLYAADLAGKPENYPAPCKFQRADLQKDRLPWPGASMGAITCMHLVEHLGDLTNLMQEAARLLEPGGGLYIETPHPRTLKLPSPTGKGAGTFTINFHDDPTHARVVPVEELAELARQQVLVVEASGVSRNKLFAASHLIYQFMPPSRQKYTAFVHWVGWSAYLIARKPAAK